MLARSPGAAARGCLLAASLAAAVPAAASSFSIAPIRVEMGAGRSRGVLTLHNDGAVPVTVQVESVAWSQPGGKDQYGPTHDLITTPPVFVVPANSEQIVRVALRRDADATRELAYRLFFEEVPAQSDKSFNGLQVALRIGIPVFVAPTVKPTAALSWQLRHAAAGRLQIEASNHGTAHLQVTDFAVQFGSQSPVHVGGARYVLPDSAVSWDLSAPADFDPKAPVHVHGFSDQGEISADVAASP